MMRIGRVRFSPRAGSNSNKASSIAEKLAEYEQIDSDCFSVNTALAEHNVPISGSGELTVAKSLPNISKDDDDDDDDDGHVAVTDKKKSSSTSTSVHRSSRKVLVGRSKSPSSSRRTKIVRSKSPSSCRRSKRMTDDTQSDVKDEGTAAPFVQLGLSSSTDEQDMVIGWARNASKAEKRKGPKTTKICTSQKPPLPPPSTSRPATPSSDDRKSRSKSRSRSPGTRRQQRKQQIAEEVSTSKSTGSSSPIMTKRRSSSREKKERRRRLKEECLDVSSDIEIAWHRNTGPLTDKSHIQSHATEKPGSINSIVAQQTIPAHLRVYGAATKSSPSASTLPKSPVQRLETVTDQEDCTTPVVRAKVIHDLTKESSDDQRGYLDSTSFDNDGPQMIETPTRGRRIVRNAPTRIAANSSSKKLSKRSSGSECPMSWRRENVVRTSSRCKSHTCTIRKVKMAQRNSTQTEEASSSTAINSQDKIVGSKEVDKTAQAALRRANAKTTRTIEGSRAKLDGDTVEKSEMPRRTSSLDRSGGRAVRKIRYVPGKSS